MKYFKKFLSPVFFLFLFYLNTFSQNTDESWKVFDDSRVGRVDITIAPAALAYLYKFVDSDSEFVAKIRFRNRYIDQTIDSVGFRLRGNTSRASKKKSFKISFNSYLKGGKFFGLEKLNLNGEHNDPSIIRSKLSFDHFRSIGLNASRASHMEVYINNDYYGLYMSIEHIDEEFLKRRFLDNSGNLWKCLYPADLTYLGDDPVIYRNLGSGGTPVYDLSTNQSNKGGYSQLARLIKIANKIPAALYQDPLVFQDSLESIIDVAEVLKYLSMNILLGSWDSYWTLRNNYYLYHEPSAGLFHIIPYDYDNTFGIEWGNANWSAVNPYSPPKVSGGSQPLAANLMADSKYRNLYTHFLEFYSNNLFKLSLWETHIDSLQQMITPYALNDTYRTLDWHFTTSDFFNSFSSSSYSNQHVKFGLKQYVNLRNDALKNQLNYLSAKPVIYKFNCFPENPAPGDSVYVTVSAFSNMGISNASIKLLMTGESTEISYPLKFSPVAGTKKVEESDRYIGVIPPLGKGITAVFYVSVKDNQNLEQTYPVKGKISLIPSASDNIVINEFLADNLNSFADPSGDHDDWIELFNPANSSILLSGKYLTDDPAHLNKWKFPDDSLYLKPLERIVIWLDEQQNQPGLHANFKLSKSGEFIAVVDSDSLTVIDSISFGRQSTDVSFGRYPDGTNNWQFMTPSPGIKNNNTVSAVKEITIPSYYMLNAYPNPFNPNTIIQYQIKASGFVSLKIFNALGRELNTLVNEEKHAGTYKLNFNGSSFPSGIYFCRLQSAGQTVKTIKLMLMK